MAAMFSSRKLISIAFGDLNPFPLRQIRNRRAYHLEKVRLELMELEAIREDFLRERETNPDKRDLISDDEEDGWRRPSGNTPFPATLLGGPNMFLGSWTKCVDFQLVVGFFHNDSAKQNVKAMAAGNLQDRFPNLSTWLHHSAFFFPRGQIVALILSVHSTL